MGKVSEVKEVSPAKRFKRDFQDDDQKQMTQRAKTALKRTLIQKFNIRAENEGDAIEKLRLRLENSQNRNRARG